MVHSCEDATELLDAAKDMCNESKARRRKADFPHAAVKTCSHPFGLCKSSNSHNGKVNGFGIHYGNAAPRTTSKSFTCLRISNYNIKRLIYSFAIVVFFTALTGEARTLRGSSFQKELSGLLNSQPGRDRSSRIIRERHTRRRRSILDNAAGFNPPEPDYGVGTMGNISKDNKTGSDRTGSDYDSGPKENFSTDLVPMVSPGLIEIVQHLYAGPVCSFIDVRNSPDGLKDLENCTVVNGYVHIVFMHNANESDFEKYTFPKLQVITEYLLLYRVYGLRSLRRMFPNLAVIGGRKIFDKYAMVIFENPQLQELGLGNLQHIGRGGVRIQKNSKLCYLETVDWRRLGMLGDNLVNEDVGSPVILDNLHSDETCLDQCGDESVCQRSVDARQHCWGLNLCQKQSCPKECPNACKDGECMCHEECLSGCTAPNNASACLACRNVYFNGTCVSECPPNSYLESWFGFKKNSWHCVTREWCVGILNWLIHDGQCRQNCPRDHHEVSDEDYNYYCEHCGKNCQQGACGEVYDEHVLIDPDGFKQYSHCSKFLGRLVISLSRGDFFKQIEEILQGIEEVGALVIRRSESLVSLSMLKNLKRITGAPDALIDGIYSFYVLENQNLRELFPAANSTELESGKETDGGELEYPLQIDGGKAFFHFNPRLCMREIEKVRELTKEVEDDKDISEITNGDRGTCDMMPLNIKEIKHMPMGDDNYATVRIIWEMVKIGDPRTLIGYQVFYKESKFTNATRFEGVFACGKTSEWAIKDKLVDPHKTLPQNGSNTSDAVLHDLKPFTQYAVYVRTYTTSTAKKGAQSDIQYFMTEPSRPTEPVALSAQAVNTSAILVEWRPPTFPNGLITHYIIRWRRQIENLEVIRSIDLCKLDIPAYVSKPLEPADEPDVVPRQPDPPEGSRNPGGGKDCCKCDGAKILPKHEEEANNNLKFETFLFRNMFRVQRYPTFDNSHSSRRRRSLEDLDHLLIRHKRGIPIMNFSLSDDSSTFITGNSTTSAPTVDFSEQSATQTPSNPTEEEDDEFHWHMTVTDSNNVTLQNLHHFSEYEIQVFACNNASGMNLQDCSIESITSKRTRSLETADVIPAESLKTVDANVRLKSGEIVQQLALKWDQPVDPNGYVKLYTIDIQRKDEGDYKTVHEPCFSLGKFEKNHGIYPLPRHLSPGQYRARAMPLTLARKGLWTDFVLFEIADTATQSPAQRNIWIAAMLAGVICMVLLFIGGWFYFKRRSDESKNAMIYSSANPEYVSLAANYIPDGYEVDEDDVELLREIGHGNFGKVYAGYANNVVKGEEKTQVAIKKLHERSSIHKRMEFLEEAKIMKAFNATHVVRLLGVVSQVPDPLVIMEYMENGDLKSHLRSRRDDAEVDDADRLPPPTLAEKLQMATEIADGMAYLSSIKYVHRDLAARNCLVNADGVVKIGDFGLTRDIYEMDYYRKGSRGLLPIRWMAPESLKDGVFDSRSDIWSYGVVLWEIATLAEQPYQGLPHDQVTRFVIDGGYMEKPHGCAEKLYDLMLNCWQFNANMRPTFMEILAMFSNEVNERFRAESYYHEYKREHPDEFRIDEETALMNSLNASLRGEGSRRGTPKNATPSRSRSDTPRSCHTPASRNSNGSTKDAGDMPLNAQTKIPNGVINGFHQSPRVENGITRNGSGVFRKPSSNSQRGRRAPAANLKKTPPSTLTRRGEDFYYSLSSSGVEADFTGTDFTESEMNESSSVENESSAVNDAGVMPPNGNQTPWVVSGINDHQRNRYSPDADIAYAALSTPCPEAKGFKKSPSTSSNKGHMEQDALMRPIPDLDRPYAHMNGFSKRNDSFTKLRSPKRNLSRHSPGADDESSYIDTSPQLNSKYFEPARQNHLLPFRTHVNGPHASPPPSPPPFPPSTRSVSAL